ncbi:MAG: tetratricopeptide repeat protein [Duncaniella sp.]|nr:tetratricopeptide repeat protein [Duncaniella sp.]
MKINSPRLLSQVTFMLLLFMSLSTTASAQTQDIEERIEYINSYVNTNPDSALILCEEALAGKLGKDNKARTALLTISGNAYFTLGDNANAIRYFNRAVDTAIGGNDTIGCVNALSDLGVAYRVNQQPDSALICYNRALSLLENSDDPFLESNILISISILFGHQRRYGEAISFAEKGVAKAMMTDDIETQIYAVSTLGTALFLDGQKDRGLAEQRKIIQVAEHKGVPRYILKTYASIISMHHRLGNQDSVRYYIRRGEALMPKVPAASVESIGFMEQSFMLLTSMGRYKESLDIQKKILEMNDSRPFLPLNRLWQRIALNYKGLGDIENTADAYERSIAFTDSIYDTRLDEQMAEFNVRYQTAEKELQISRLETAKARRDTILTIIAAILTISAIAFYVWSRNRRRKIELQTVRAQLDGIEQERARLAHELHDGVCNDLLGLELMAAAKNYDHDEFTSMLKTVRKEVRSISHELLPPRFNGLSLSQLLYAYVQQSDGLMRLETSVGETELSPLQSVNLYRIVQEWTGNLRTHNNPTYIEIKLDSDPNLTTLEITDNGTPFDPDCNQSRGLGIENIKHRIKALNGIWTVRREGSTNVMTVKISTNQS